MSSFGLVYNSHLENIEESLSEQGFNEETVCEIADNMILESFAKAITAQCFRNGLIEDLHSEIPALTDEVMKKLNKDVCNRVYTFLLLCLSDDMTSAVQLLYNLAFGNMCTSSWDSPEIVDNMLMDLDEKTVFETYAQL